MGPPRKRRKLLPLDRLRVRRTKFRPRKFDALHGMSRFEERTGGVTEKMFARAMELIGKPGLSRREAISVPAAKDYLHSLKAYWPDYEDIRRLFPRGLKGKTVVQLAGSFGPFMLFLQEEEKARAIVVDPDRVAEQVAREFGLKNFVRASAQNTTLPSSSVDCLHAAYFLDTDYIYVQEGFLRSERDRQKTIQGFENIFREAARVLKPGGIFFITSFNPPEGMNYNRFLHSAGFEVVEREPVAGEKHQYQKLVLRKKRR